MNFLFLFCALVFIHSISAVCKYPADKEIENRCYSFVAKKHHFKVAKEYCESYGSSLATVDNMIVDKYLAELAVSHFNKSYGFFWIGLSRHNSSDEFHWDDGTPYSFSNFEKGFPNSHHYVKQSIHNGKWETATDHNELDFVCSYYGSETTTTTLVSSTTASQPSTTVIPSTTTKKHGCPEGFTLFNSTMKCYSVIVYGNDSDYPNVPTDSAPLTKEAQRCAAYGATVATIHSEDMNDLFRSLIYDKFNDTRYATIGLKNTNSEIDGGDWEWIDNSAKDFLNFGDSFPKSADLIAQMSINGYWVSFTHTSSNEGVICAVDY